MFIQVGNLLVPEAKIRRVDCSRLMSDMVAVVETVEDDLEVHGMEAVDLVMRLHPAYFEGRPFRWVRHAWVLHNLVGHPGMQLLAWLGQTRLGLQLHDRTIPRPR